MAINRRVYRNDDVMCAMTNAQQAARVKNKAVEAMHSTKREWFREAAPPPAVYVAGRTTTCKNDIAA